MRLLSKRTLPGLACFAAALWLNCAYAEDDLQDAFAAMMRAPGDAALTLRYAELATRAGDLEGALGALTRLLMADPDNAEIHRELGVLYRALGSNDAAETHDRRALELSSDDTQRGAILGELALLQNVADPDHFSLLLQSGLGFQTNSAIATQQSGAYEQEQPKAKPDENAELYANGSYSRQFDGGLAERWDSNLILFATRQFRYKQDDTAYARLTSGPTFLLFGSPGTVLRTYGIGEVFALGSYLYLYSGGGGLSWDQDLGSRITTRLEVETTKRWFNDSEVYQGLSQQDAKLVLIRATLAHTFDGGDRIGLRNWSVANVSQLGFASYREYGVAPVYELHFPSLWDDGTWLAVVDGRFVRRPYREAAPGGPILLFGMNGGNATRDDTEWGGSVTLYAPITARLSLVAKASQMNQTSTISNFRYRNAQITTSAQYNF